ncbi:MAG: aminotransferase class IV [Desulfobacterales bacterium]|nr:aminotransferase class IV [Desulfobacterales bacterium]
MGAGTHSYQQDDRNKDIKIYVNGSIVHRDDAKISVFDSGFLLGDGIWESFRFNNGKLAFVDHHMYRLRESAAALDMDLGMTNEEILAAIYSTLEANDMKDDVHIRLVFSRGMKRTPFQDPRANIGPCTLVIIPEYKILGDVSKGISLYTVYNRRGRPDVQDPKLHPLSKLNCVLSCIQATKAGADEALMLDPNGFVATCNSTSFFIVRQGEVWTSSGDYCLHGITRATTIEICKENGIPVKEKNFSLLESYVAEESFVTGTFGGLRHVSSIDGRVIGDGELGPVTKKLQALYEARLDKECE